MDEEPIRLSSVVVQQENGVNWIGCYLEDGRSARIILRKDSFDFENQLPAMTNTQPTPPASIWSKPKQKVAPELPPLDEEIFSFMCTQANYIAEETYGLLRLICDRPFPGVHYYAIQEGDLILPLAILTVDVFAGPNRFVTMYSLSYSSSSGEEGGKTYINTLEDFVHQIERVNNLPHIRSMVDRAKKDGRNRVERPQTLRGSFKVGGLTDNWMPKPNGDDEIFSDIAVAHNTGEPDKEPHTYEVSVPIEGHASPETVDEFNARIRAHLAEVSAEAAMSGCLEVKRGDGVFIGKKRPFHERHFRKGNGVEVIVGPDYFSMLLNGIIPGSEHDSITSLKIKLNEQKST
jgi:hypothetical protein